MTIDTNRAPRRTAACPGLRAGIPAAAFAALLLAACSATHVGDDWQCPLAKGGTCDSVAEADPAVPDPAAAGSMTLHGPLYRIPDAGAGETAPLAAPCDAACDGGFDPFAWLARLFGPDAAERKETAATGPVRLVPPEAPPAATLPDDTGPARDESVREGPHEDDLRTGEVVARIWIAPFVDGNGVYREASHVRVVLEPAGWRLK